MQLSQFWFPIIDKPILSNYSYFSTHVSLEVQFFYTSNALDCFCQNQYYSIQSSHFFKTVAVKTIRTNSNGFLFTHFYISYPAVYLPSNHSSYQLTSHNAWFLAHQNNNFVRIPYSIMNKTDKEQTVMLYMYVYVYNMYTFMYIYTLTDLEDLSEREQLMLIHLIVTGATFPFTGTWPFSSSSSGRASGSNSGPGPEKRRSSRAAATAASSWPTPPPPFPPILSISLILCAYLWFNLRLSGLVRRCLYTYLGYIRHRFIWICNTGFVVD